MSKSKDIPVDITESVMLIVKLCTELKKIGMYNSIAENALADLLKNIMDQKREGSKP